MTHRISIDPAVCHGQPVVAGTRVLVSTILGALAGGDSIETVLEDYPSLEREHIRAALQWARDVGDRDVGDLQIATDDA